MAVPAPAGTPLYVYQWRGQARTAEYLSATVPQFMRITVIGVCMTDDTISPIIGIYKNVTIEFSMGAGPDTEYQFAATFTTSSPGGYRCTASSPATPGSRASTRCSRRCVEVATAASTT